MINSQIQAQDTKHHAVIIGEGSLADAVAEVMASRKVTVTRETPESFKPEMLKTLRDAGNAPTLVFNVWYPNPTTDGPNVLSSYPQTLLEQSLIAADTLSEQKDAAIINFAFLPAIYVGTDLEDHVPALRGGITGVTRTLARKFGRKGIRVTCVQAGLVDMPETQAWVSDTVKQVQVPSKRWATPLEVAKFMSFLAIDSLYTTGQTMIIDGGLTAGITGT